MNSAPINPSMIALARESRGLSQLELAHKLGISTSHMSRLEQEAGTASAYLPALASALGYPEPFFGQPGENLPPLLALRKRKKVPQKILQPIEAQANIFRLQLQKLLPAVNYHHTPLPVTDPLKAGSPAAAAQKLRRLWNMDKGPVNNLSATLEDKGLLLMSFDFGTERVDGLSALAGPTPVIFNNARNSGDRQRFTLAYELGHLVMHLYTSPSFSRDLGREASLFAAELLMPEKDIRQDLKEGVTLNLLADLKRKWKVSMQALLYRAHDLELITDNQKRYLVNQFNTLNIRRREPVELDVPRETPLKVRQLVTLYKQKQRLSVKQMALFMNLSENEFLTSYST